MSTLGLDAESIAKSSLETLLDDRYQLVGTLSQSVFWGTHIAIDTHTNNRSGCIVRELRSAHQDSAFHPVAQTLFEHELKILEKLGHHEQISQLLDAFQTDAAFYIVQELIDGHPLTAEFRAHQPWPESRVVELLASVLSVLDFVHRQGFVHGDLQPDNLIRQYPDGQLILTDFRGIKQICMPLVQVCDQIRSTITLGSAGYMSPEQMRGNSQANSDIYALGMIGIQALTGLSPLQLEDDPKTGEVVWQHHVQSLMPTSENLVNILTRMVRYHFRDRYQDAGEVLQALTDLAKDATTQETAGSNEENKPIQEADLADHLSLNSDELDTATTAGIETVQPKLDDRNADEDTHEALVSHSVSDNQASLSSDQTQPPSSFDTEHDASSHQSLESAPSEQQSSLLEENSGLKQQSESKLWKIAGFATSATLMSAAGGYLLFSGSGETIRDSVDWQLWEWMDRGNAVLNEANERYQAGNFQAAVDLASSIPAKSNAYNQAQSEISQWRQAWEQTNQQFQSIETAFEAKQWVNVIEQAQAMPESEFWQNRLAPMVQRSQHQLDQKATYALAEAAQIAQTGNFQGAISALEDVSDIATVYEQIQEKRVAYQAQYEEQADKRLKQAYDAAESKDFTTALSILEAIPEDTSVYDDAQAKVQEYVGKERIRATYHLQRAYNRAILKDFEAALNHLLEIPEGTPAYTIAQEKIQEYSQKQLMKSAPSIAQTPVQLGEQNVDLEPTIKPKAELTEGSSEEHFDTKVSTNTNLNPGDYIQAVK